MYLCLYFKIELLIKKFSKNYILVSDMPNQGMSPKNYESSMDFESLKMESSFGQRLINGNNIFLMFEMKCYNKF